MIIVTLDANTPGQVTEPRFVEVPIAGPGTANTLVVITGLANPGYADVDTDTLTFGEVTIKTQYLLGPGDTYLGIVDNNSQLLAASLVSLTHMAIDDDELSGPTGFTVAVDTVDTSIGSDNRVWLKVGIALQGETDLLQFSYQASVVLQKAA